MISPIHPRKHGKLHACLSRRAGLAFVAFALALAQVLTLSGSGSATVGEEVGMPIKHVSSLNSTD